MREIKFRGKVDSIKGGWVYGSFINLKEKGTRIRNYVGIQYPVIEDSVGQYTGLKDNNGKEIYEGDVFRETDERDDGDVVTYHIVTWIKEFGCFALVPNFDYDQVINNEKWIDLDELKWLSEQAGIYDFCVDIFISPIVGNIHDNPELLTL